MNRIHRSLWNEHTATFVAVAENARSVGRKMPSGTAVASSSRFGLKALTVALMVACGGVVWAQPTGGVVSAGAATIGGAPGAMVINQTTPNVAINWQSFGIQAGESVQFVQPSTSSVALNRVNGPNPSNILGSLSANGKVFLVNPNGILFGKGATVNVGGLVASTLGMSDTDFMASNYRFSGAGAGAVVNQGTVTAADGGYVALLGAKVSNQGVVAARLGTVALAAGNEVTLDMAGDKLLSLAVKQGAVDALVDNGGVIRADGGYVLMTTQVAGSLLSNAVNNTGVVQAQTVQESKGTIMLMGGMSNGTMNVAGTLDASAPAGGDGGFIETSAANVKIANGVKVTTAAASGKTGSWLIDPQDFIIGSLPTDNISGTTLSALLVTNSVTISTDTGNDAAVAGTPPSTNLFTATPGNGDIFVNDAVAWTASSSPTTLTLLAVRDTNINASISATNGNLVVCCGRDVNVRSGADITTVNGSVLLSAGNNINLRGALTTTNGNVSMCAANNINIVGKLTLTQTTSIVPGQSLGLPLGLVLSAGYGASRPGPGGGTVVFGQPATVTNAPTTITYNPVSYTTPTDYATSIIGPAPVQRMLVYVQAEDKEFDGTTRATLSSRLQGRPVGDVSLRAGRGSVANFNNARVGRNKRVTYRGFTLAGADATRYALPEACCGGLVARTTADITAAPAPVAPAPAAPPAVAPSPSPVAGAPAPIADTPPPVLTPFTPTPFVSQGYAFTVIPATPLPYPTLVVQAPAAQEPLPVVTPETVPVEAPPAPYRAPVRNPRAERN